MEVISPFVLRAMACDMEEMQSPQAWADRCRAAAAEIERLRAENAKLAASNHAYLSDYQEAIGEIEKLRAALQTARRDALAEAARRLEELHSQHKYNSQTGEGSEHDTGYYRALSEGAAWILALGEKE